MSPVGTSIDLLDKYVAGTPQYPISDDPSQDLLYFLAMAHNAVRRLEDRGVDLVLQGQPLVSSALQRAYREAQYVRSKRMPWEDMDVTTISRFGRLQQK